MFKKEKEQEDEMHESSKPKENRTAYEDSWYRSLKALADMRPVEEEVADARPVEDDEEAGVPED